MECWFYWLLIMRENYFVVILFFYCCADLCCWELQCFMSFSRVIGGYLSTLWICLPGCHMRMLIFGDHAVVSCDFCVGDFVYRDNIEKTNDVFLARDFSNLEYLTGKLVGVVVAFLVLNVISMFICMLIHLFASSFKFNVGLYLSIYWQFLYRPYYSCPVWLSWWKYG